MLQVQYNQGPNEETEIEQNNKYTDPEGERSLPSMLINGMPNMPQDKKKRIFVLKIMPSKLRALSLHGNMFESRLQYILTPL